jgi:hypothetical protein
MRDPTTDLVVKRLTEIAVQYLYERNLQETNEAINALFAWGEKRIQSGKWGPGWERRPPRKRGRPQRCERNAQIAGAVALLVEDFGLKPTRSHVGQRQGGYSACSIVTAALEPLNEYYECLDERTVEGIWNRYRRSPRIIHLTSRDFIRNRFNRSTTLNSMNC